MILSDGTALPADLMVLATGYRLDEWLGGAVDFTRKSPTRSAGAGASVPTRQRIPAPGKASRAICGSPPGRRRLWFHGGNLHQSRHYSQYLVLAAEGSNGRACDASLCLARSLPQGMRRSVRTQTENSSGLGAVADAWGATHGDRSARISGEQDDPSHQTAHHPSCMKTAPIAQSRPTFDPCTTAYRRSIAPPHSSPPQSMHQYLVMFVATSDQIRALAITIRPDPFN